MAVLRASAALTGFRVTMQNSATMQYAWIQPARWRGQSLFGQFLNVTSEAADLAGSREPPSRAPARRFGAELQMRKCGAVCLASAWTRQCPAGKSRVSISKARAHEFARKNGDSLCGTRLAQLGAMSGSSRTSLPLLPTLAARGRRLPLAEARSADAQYRPIYAVWELTLRCDLACRHCGSRAGRPRPDELTLPEALDLVEQLADLGVREVTLIGGEAYLYDGWLEVVRAIVRHDMVCTVTSGGRGFTPALARAAAEAGVQSVSISIDGGPETHDRLRGLKGAHRSAVAALDALRAAGIQLAINTQVNRRNRGELEQVFELAREHGCHGWQVFLTVPMGRACDDPDLLLQPYDVLELLPVLGDLHTRCAAEGIRLLPGNNVGYFGPQEHRLRGALRAPSQASCAAGRVVIGIEANGDIKGCPSLPTRDWVGGNVREHRLRDIWERSPALRYTRDRTVEHDLWGYCKTCYYAEVCRGGCTWTAHTLFGRPGNNPYCHHRALDLQSKGLRERLVPVAEAPGEAFDYGRWVLLLEPIPTARVEPSL